MIKSQKIIEIEGREFQFTEWEPDGPPVEIAIERIAGEVERWADENGNVVMEIRHEAIKFKECNNETA